MTRMYLRAAVAAALALGAASAAAQSAYTISFDTLTAGTQAGLDPVAQANGVSFVAGQLDPDLDLNGDPILDPAGNLVPGSTHWAALVPTAPLTVANPNAFGYGAAPSGTLALNALNDQTLIRFTQPAVLTGFSFKLDGSTFGDLIDSQVLLLDGAGKTLLASAPFTGSGTSAFSMSFAATAVSAILLPSTSKFYDDITITPVPEPGEVLMMGAGLAMLGLVVRRRRTTTAAVA